MKKYLPLILLLVGALLVAGIFLIRGKKNSDDSLENGETALIEVPLEDRPIVSLTPTSDGHYLTLKVDKIVIDVTSVDYLLLYYTDQGIQQGVPGTVDLSSKDSFEEKLLLGSESAGKFRYDEGVETGSVELKFRNEKGQLVAKFKTNFEMEQADDGYQVTMNTVGGTSETEKTTFSSE
jgi:hypothetical protein